MLWELNPPTIFEKEFPQPRQWMVGRELDDEICPPVHTHVILGGSPQLVSG